jgi:Clostridial hydrophobic W
MSDATNRTPSVHELKVTAHMMSLEPGVFCIFQSPSHSAPDASGLPGVRLSPPPGVPPEHCPVDILGFTGDGWLNEFHDALLLRVRQPTQILVTIYQQAADQVHSPNLQVVRVGNSVAADAQQAGPQQAGAAPQGPQPMGAPPQAAPRPPMAAVPLPAKPDVTAHIQSRGDVGGQFAAWLGEPGSKRWMEGYSVNPPSGLAPEDIEYQSVLGRGWMSPWVSGSEFCGSRGMALPILGLRLRLRGAAEDAWSLSAEASFVDGARSGPVGSGELLESPSLAPLEAFLLKLEPKQSAAAPAPAQAELSEERKAPPRRAVASRQRSR